jgi:hypothetical protein
MSLMYTLASQCSLVNSMFIHNNWSLFIDEGRASVNLPNALSVPLFFCFGKPREGWSGMGIYGYSVMRASCLLFIIGQAWLPVLCVLLHLLSSCPFVLLSDLHLLALVSDVTTSLIATPAICGTTLPECVLPCPSFHKNSSTWDGQ